MKTATTAQVKQASVVIKLVSRFAPKTKRIKRSNQYVFNKSIQAQYAQNNGQEFTPDTEF